ncbi:DUF1405 domain-containing protein [Paenibacillus sp. tmac-D7]|uniref:DUF1405 domain-containing protein n=1 Tax=Paenibacillus sp. tmac-D7 TaxID=2591462 RepID=UPI00114254A7|nr:DUF1405 domain-containing protein [Paenibacillus sp. tmac-D7]
MTNWRLSYYVSTPFLGSRLMLWSLFVINLLGTVYGYEWYWKQLLFTSENFGNAYLPFVPDSPTASLFFTCFIGFLLWNVDKQTGIAVPPERAGWLRGCIEAFALITSFKYGVWAVAMIWAGAYQGDGIVWQDWMLTISHLGMAAEALLYARFYRYMPGAVLIVAAWTLWNDAMDYGAGVFPWLPETLLDDLGAIRLFTMGLSFIGIAIAIIIWLIRYRKHGRILQHKSV